MGSTGVIKNSAESFESRFRIPAHAAYLHPCRQKKAPTKGWGISIQYRGGTEGGEEGGSAAFDKDGLLLNHEFIMCFKRVFELYVLVEVKRLFELTG